VYSFNNTITLRIIRCGWYTFNTKLVTHLFKNGFKFTSIVKCDFNGLWVASYQQLWNVSITAPALLSGIETISNHPVSGSIAVRALSFFVPLGVLTDQGPTK
jgi:hypothetical protein